MAFGVSFVKSIIAKIIGAAPLSVDGTQPKLRPLGLHFELNGKICFGVGKFKDVYKQLQANPQVEIVACKQNAHWLRYTGTAVFDNEPEYTEKAFETMPELRELYPDPSIMGVFHLENATAVDIYLMGEGENLL